MADQRAMKSGERIRDWEADWRCCAIESVMRCRAVSLSSGVLRGLVARGGMDLSFSAGTRSGSWADILMKERGCVWVCGRGRTPDGNLAERRRSS